MGTFRTFVNQSLFKETSDTIFIEYIKSCQQIT